MRRLNIALIVHDLHSHGGHSTYTKVLADEFSQRHDVTVFANYCERSEDTSWRFEPVRAARTSALTTVLSFPYGLRLLERRLGKYDIRHAQGFCGDHPNVVTAHICVAAYLESLRGASRRHLFTLQRMANAEERFYRRYRGRVIAVSAKVAGELRSHYDVRTPITVVHHGVDAMHFARGLSEANAVDLVRTQLEIDARQMIALYVGDLTKAHLYLKELARAAPWLTLVIVSYSQAYRWAKENVRFVSSTRDLRPYYSAADAFVFPTTYDAFGMVLLEAMASGLPVFTSDCAGAAELILDGENGFVFPLADWVEETIAGLKDGGVLQTTGRAALKTARGQDWAKVTREVEQVYLDVHTQVAVGAQPSLKNLAVSDHAGS